MKKSIKLSIFLILVLAIALSVFGCAKKTPGKAKKPGKQTEQKESEKKMTDEEIESLFEMEAIDEEEYMVKSYKGALTDVKIPSE